MKLQIILPRRGSRLRQARLELPDNFDLEDIRQLFAWMEFNKDVLLGHIEEFFYDGSGI